MYDFVFTNLLKVRADIWRSLTWLNLHMVIWFWAQSILAIAPTAFKNDTYLLQKGIKEISK